MTGYNGYENWDTWNVCLWMQNEEPLYRAACSFSGRHGGDVSIAAAKEFFLSEMGGDTPDGVNREAINWFEVAECLDGLYEPDDDEGEDES